MKTKFLNYRKFKSIQFVSLISLLWAMADALVAFYIPIQMQTFLHNITLFGFLFGIAALVGAMSDIILGALSNRVRYVTFLLIGLLLSVIVAVSAMIPFSLLLIIFLMIVWGLYYEFIEIGIFSYVSRYHHSDEQAKYFGIIYLFVNAAYVIAPIVGGYLVIYGSRVIYGLCLFFTALAFLFIPLIANLHKKREKPFLVYKTVQEHYDLKKQFRNYKKIWKYASIFFVVAFLYNVWDSFIWTLIPIQSIGGNPIIAGIITSTFTIPLALLEGYGGKIADKFGKNATFIAGLFIASLFTYIFGQQTSIVLKIITSTIAALGFAFAYPAVMGKTSEKAQAHEKILGEMAGVQRIFVNGGFILGPIIGGIFANFVGIQHAFSLLGIVMLTSFVPIVFLMMHFHVKGRIHKVVLSEFEM